MGRGVRSVRTRCAFFLVLAFLFAALGTSLAYGAQISGTVRDSLSGDPLPHAYVEFTRYQEGAYSMEAWLYTDEAGAYEYTPEQLDDYYVLFRANGYADQYFEQAIDFGGATPISVVNGDEVFPGVDGDLEWQGYSIGGTVTDEYGAAIPGVFVVAYSYDGVGWQYEMGTWADDYGRYVFGALPDGEYRLSFADYNYGYLSEYYQDAADIDSATSVFVTAGLPQTCDVVLGMEPAAEGTVFGTLTDEITGEPITEGYAGAITQDEFGTWYWTEYGGYTDENGYYEFTAPVGEYVIGFLTWDYYKTEFWQETTDVSLAAPVELVAGGTHEFDAALSPNFAFVSGTVTDDVSGVGIDSAVVEAWYWASEEATWTAWDWSTETDENGAYTLRLPADKPFRLSFTDGEYVTEYYQDASSVEDAQDVVLAPAGGFACDVSLSPAPPSITGTVREAGSGDAIESAWVDSVWSDGEGGWVYADWAETDANGEYSLYGLGDGQYAVWFDSWGHFPAYYDGKTSVETADPVTTTSGATVNGIDGTLQQRGAATIQGTVTGLDSGQPLPGVDVYLLYQSEWGWVDCDWTTTDTDGAYSLQVLEGRSYIVEFDDPEGRYAWEYHSDTTDTEAAVVLSPSAGEVLVADESLIKNATISGAVLDEETSSGIPYASVSLHRSDGSGGWEYDYDWCSTDESGAYTFYVEPGTYLVQFFAPGGTYLTEYWMDATDEAAATPVEILGSEDWTGVNGTLTPNFGTISGVLTEDGTGEPIADGEIVAWIYDADAGEWFECEWAYTDEQGAYSIRLAPGEYRLSFDTWSGKHAEEYYNGKPSVDAADPVLVALDGQLTLDASLAPAPPSVTGTVREAGTMEPVPYPWVEAYEYYPEEDYWEVRSWGESDETGQYAIWGLDSGSYAIRFEAYDYLSSFYNGQPDIETADLVTTTDGETVAGIDGVLEPMGVGAISGQVLGEDTLAGVQGVAVEISMNSEEGWEWVDTIYTDADGRYRVELQAHTTYMLHFDDYDGRYLGEYYDDMADETDAMMLELMPDQELVADATLRKAATISGTVRSGVTPLAGISAVACVPDDEFGWMDIAWGWTAKDGTYTIPGLRGGAYKVLFYDWESGRYLTEFYNDKPDFDTADEVVVADGEDVSGIDADLAPAGRILGRVTDESGRGLRDIEVQAFAPDGLGGWDFVASGYSDENGDYFVGGLRTGTYRICFSDAWGYRFVTEYYNDVSDIAFASDINAAEGADTVGMDAVLASTGEWGTLSGTVKDAASGSTISAEVELLGQFEDGWQTVDSTNTGQDGSYTFEYVPNGEYLVLAYSWSGPYEAGYHLDAVDTESADRVLVDAADVTDIDVLLNAAPEAGRIEGTVVTDGAGAPVAGGLVEAFQYVIDEEYEGWVSASATLTDGNGHYSLAAWPGEYKLRFTAPPHATEWYDDAPTMDAATPIMVDTGLTSTANASLGSGGSISGTLLGGEQLGELYLRLWRQVGTEFEVFQDWTEVNLAAYSLDGLPAGTYRLEYEGFGGAGSYAGMFWRDAYDLSSAEDIVVGTGEDVTGIDLQLEPGAWVNVYVGSDDGELDWPVSVSAMRWDGAEYVLYREYETWVGDQEANFPFLPAGTYKFVVSDPTGHYEDVWYPNAVDAASAEETVIVAGDERNFFVDLDGAPPALSDDATAAYNDSATINISATDEVVGVASISYRLDSAAATTTISGAGASVSTSVFGDHTLRYAATDKLGHTASKTVTFGVDDTLLPVLSDDAQATYANTGTIHLSAVDAGSGVDRIEYSVDGGAAQTIEGASGNAEVAYGDTTLTYTAFDNAGNSASKTLDFTVTDTLAPSMTDDAKETYAGGSGTIHLSATDAGSGVDRIEYSVDGGAVQTIAGASGDVVVVTGNTTLTYTAYDKDGNSSSRTVGFTVTDAPADTTPPEVTVDNQGEYYGSATVKIAATDAGGPVTIAYKVNSEATVTPDPAPQVAITRNVVGTYTVKYVASDPSGNETAGQFTFKVLAAKLTPLPLEGNNRYETAAKIARQAYSTADTVVLATGENWPDALGGAALAGAYDGPILLVTKNSVPPVVNSLISDLGAKKVFILGGESVISKSVETSLKKRYSVTRIGGTNRYDTSRKIAKAVTDRMKLQRTGFDGRAFIATGNNFPDALAGSPISAARAWPIYLVGDKITASEMDTIESHGIDELVILGGDGVVRPTVETTLKKRFGNAAVVRKAGGNRYETAMKVAAFGVSECGLKWNKLALSTGLNFPDALAGGVLQGKDGSVMLLTPANSLDKYAASVLTANRSRIYEVRFLGGDSAISGAVRNKVKAILAK